MGTILVGEAEQKKRRRSTNYPLEFKRQLAQRACDESVSVAQLALQHGLNTNMLFRWRRQLRAGLLDTTTQFLPVALAAEPKESASVAVDGTGRIEIQLGQARICIHGAPDPATLALVLQGLRP
ncbi:IS66-like element accessory protein TnpA [Massilia varians]|uniref:IS66-like element accessory protein TnpA n=1 Tax=Massilia varians TaxID=457921 RepID=UPI0025568892|nr:transposase [Massilia varians]MDK6080398.1 transposase [Massilia varians]